MCNIYHVYSLYKPASEDVLKRYHLRAKGLRVRSFQNFRIGRFI